MGPRAARHRGAVIKVMPIISRANSRLFKATEGTGSPQELICMEKNKDFIAGTDPRLKLAEIKSEPGVRRKWPSSGRGTRAGKREGGTL